MSKELEAFNRIRLHFTKGFLHSANIYDKDLETIEKALKDKEKKDKVLDILKEETTFVFEEMNVKTHGVIVKVYQVVIGGIVGIDLYNKEKYDLLKEILYVQEEENRT